MLKAKTIVATLHLWNPTTSAQTVRVTLWPSTGTTVTRTLEVPAQRPMSVALQSWFAANTSLTFGLEAQFPTRGVATLSVTTPAGTAGTMPTPFVLCATP